MRLLRGLAGTVLWILAAVLGLVAFLLCVTILLLPVGLPLLRVSRQLFTQAVRLMLPPSVAHPVKSARKSALRRRDRATAAPAAAAAQVTRRRGTVRRLGGKAVGRARELAPQPRRSRWLFWKRGKR